MVGPVALCVASGLLAMLASGWSLADIQTGGETSTHLSVLHRLTASHAWLTQLLSLWLLVAVLARRSVGQVAGLAAAFAWVWQTSTIAWLHIGMHKYAGLEAGLSVLAVALLGVYLAGYTVVALALWAWLRQRHRLGPVRSAMLFAAAWILADLGRTELFTGFPWAHAGYAHLSGPLRPLLPWLGADGVGAVAALLGSGFALVWFGLAARRRSAMLASLAGMGLLAGLAALPDRSFTRSTGEFDALLLQGNVSQEGKFDATRMGDAMGWHAKALERSFADLTLTPETAIPVLEHQIPEAFMSRLQRRAQSREGVMLLGIPRQLPGAGQVNALLALGHPSSLPGQTAATPYRYEKAHLVPFGEFTPPGFAWFTRWLDLPMPNFRSGRQLPQPLMLRTRAGDVQRVAPLICFEDLFGGELAQRFADPRQAPTVLVNASNLAWFDDSPAMAQHLRMAQVRSVEFQRPTLRATNTGVTAMIDHLGQVQRALPLHTRDTLSVIVEGREGLTPYARWRSAFGPWALLLASGVLAGAALAAGSGRLGARPSSTPAATSGA